MIAQQGKERSQQSYDSDERRVRGQTRGWSIVSEFPVAIATLRGKATKPQAPTGNSPFQKVEAERFQAKITGPAKIIDLVAQRWDLNDTDAAALFGLQGPSEFQQIVRGLKTLSSAPDIRRRLNLVLQIRSELDGYLGKNLEAERSWLRHFEVGPEKAAPIDLLRGGDLLDISRVQSAILDYFGK